MTDEKHESTLLGHADLVCTVGVHTGNRGGAAHSVLLGRVCRILLNYLEPAFAFALFRPVCCLGSARL